MIKLLLCCVLLYLPEAICIRRSLIINTASGPVKGKINEFNGIQFYSYQGIPYAESPTGKMRFNPPVPKRPWIEVLDATEEGAVCTQLPKFYPIKEASEDCLNVNVYVPKNGTEKLLPVMVFVHGGGLQYLSGRIDMNYGPQFLLNRDIVYVSMNYRLGPFGFLSLDIEEASGNAGLKDVLLSLKWVKRNIKNFGGDPDKVTIAGHSSGALIVNLLMMTKHSNGLFKQAIQFSGSAFFSRSFARHPKDIAFILTKELGIETGDTYRVLEDLQKTDAIQILRAFYNMTKTHDSPVRSYAPFVPTKEVDSDHALFVVDPMEILRKEFITQKVPVLVGITSQEAINMIPYVHYKLGKAENIRGNLEYLIPSNIEYPIRSKESMNLAKLVSDMYFNKEMKNLTLTTLIEFISDTQNVYGVYLWIEKLKDMVDRKPIYFYLFDFNGNLNINQYIFNTSVEGVGHGDDIPYILLMHITKFIYNTIDEKTKKIMNTMINFISNFVYYGNPTPENVKNEFIWPNYGKEQNYLLLNENPVVQRFSSSLMYPRMQFWNRVYHEYYEYLKNGGEIQKKIIP